MSERHCSKCETQLTAEAKSCPECGAPAVEPSAAEASASDPTPTSVPASPDKKPTAKDALTAPLSRMFGWLGKPPKPWNSWWNKRSKRTRLGLLIGGPLAVIVVAALVVFLVFFLRPVFVVAAVETDDAVVSGEDILLSIDVANEGRTSGDYELGVFIDGEPAQTELVTLAGGTREQVPVTLSGLPAGYYDISLAKWPELTQEVWVMTPAEFEIDRVEVRPNPMDFNTTDKAEVLVEFTNIGEAEGSHEFGLTLDGQVLEVREIELEGGVSAHSTFALTVAEPGSFEVAVDDERVDLEVYQLERLDNGTKLVDQLSGSGPNRLKIMNRHEDLDCVVLLSAALGEDQSPLLAVYVRADSTYIVRRIKDGNYTVYYAIGEEWCAYREEFTRIWDRGRFEETMEVESPGWTYTEVTVEFGLPSGESSPTEDLSPDEFPDLSPDADTTAIPTPSTPAPSTPSPSTPAPSTPAPTAPPTTVFLPPDPTINVLWKFRAGNWVYSDPTISGGVVYFGSRDRCLYAVDANTGEQKWKFQTGGEVFSSPAVSGGVVYCGSNDNYLYAVDANTGEQKWRFKTGKDVSSVPAISGGVVYFGSKDSYLYALDAASGQEKWKFKTNYQVCSSPAVSGGVVYFGSQDYYFYALDAASGQEKWKFRAEGHVDSSPAVWEGKVYFADDDYLYAFDATTGGQKWRFETRGTVSCRLAVSGGVVYFGDSHDYLYAVDAGTGIEKWKFRTGGHVSSSPAVSGGAVYFGSEDDYLYALNAQTGEEWWKFETGESVSSSPAISGGVVYFGSWDKYLYALKTE